MAFKLRLEPFEDRLTPADPPLMDPITGLPILPPGQTPPPPQSPPGTPAPGKGPIDPGTNPNIPRATDPGDAPPPSESTPSDFNGANVG